MCYGDFSESDSGLKKSATSDNEFVSFDRCLNMALFWGQ